MKFENIKTITIIILLLLLGFMFWKSNKNFTNFQEQKTLVESLNSNLEVWKDKEGKSRAKIQAIETRRAKDFLALQSKDSIVIELQQEVKKFKSKLKKSGSVTIVKTETTIDTVLNSVIVSNTDTIRTDSFVYIYPTYTRDFNFDDWIIGTMSMSKDSASLTGKAKNEYSIVLGEDSNGWFKPGTPFADVSNANPFSETTAVRTYKVAAIKPKRIGLGGYVGYGVTVSKEGLSHGVQAGGGIVFKLTF